MNKNIHFLLLLFCCLVSFVSCKDETPQKQTSGVAHLYIKGGTLYDSNYPSNAELDDKIVTLRILGFDAMGMLSATNDTKRKKAISSSMRSRKVLTILYSSPTNRIRRIHHR